MVLCTLSLSFSLFFFLFFFFYVPRGGNNTQFVRRTLCQFFSTPCKDIIYRSLRGLTYINAFLLLQNLDTSTYVFAQERPRRFLVFSHCRQHVARKGSKILLWVECGSLVSLVLHRPEKLSVDRRLKENRHDVTPVLLFCFVFFICLSTQDLHTYEYLYDVWTYCYKSTMPALNPYCAKTSCPGLYFQVRVLFVP